MAEPVLGIGLPLLLLLAGTGMMVAEAVIPGAQFVVVGVALFLAGLVGVLVGGWFASIVALTVMTIAFGVFAYFAFREMDLYNGPDHGQTMDSDSLTGETATVTERVTNHSGSVRLNKGGGFDPNYRARSEHGPIEEGEEVLITDPGGGNVVYVQAMDYIEEDSIDRELARGRTPDGGGQVAPEDVDPERDDETVEDAESDEASETERA